MASKAMTNTMAALTVSGFLAERVSLLYKDRPRNKTVLEMCSKLNAHVFDARNYWPKVDASEVYAIAERLVYFELQVCKPQVTIPEWSSVCLGMLDEVLSHLKDKRRREAIERVMAGVNAMHRYFDRRGDRDDDYESAGEVVDKWQEMVA